MCFLGSSMQYHAESFGNHPKKQFLDPKRAKLKKKCKSTCKTSTQIHGKSYKSIVKHPPPSSSDMPRGGQAAGETGGMWEEVVGASLWISVDFRRICWVDFLHVDSHLYFDYLQSIIAISPGRHVLTEPVSLYYSYKLQIAFLYKVYKR